MTQQCHYTPKASWSRSKTAAFDSRLRSNTLRTGGALQQSAVQCRPLRHPSMWTRSDEAQGARCGWQALAPALQPLPSLEGRSIRRDRICRVTSRALDPKTVRLHTIRMVTTGRHFRRSTSTPALAHQTGRIDRHSIAAVRRSEYAATTRTPR